MPAIPSTAETAVKSMVLRVPVTCWGRETCTWTLGKCSKEGHPAVGWSIRDAVGLGLGGQGRLPGGRDVLAKI